jgi:hypothetical protein
VFPAQKAQSSGSHLQIKRHEDWQLVAESCQGSHQCALRTCGKRHIRVLHKESMSVSQKHPWCYHCRGEVQKGQEKGVFTPRAGPP